MSVALQRRTARPASTPGADAHARLVPGRFSSVAWRGFPRKSSKGSVDQRRGPNVDQKNTGQRKRPLTCEFMVGVRRFELLTSSVSGKRSPPELNARTAEPLGDGSLREGEVYARVVPRARETDVSTFAPPHRRARAHRFHVAHPWRDRRAASGEVRLAAGGMGRGAVRARVSPLADSNTGVR
jgi:hypothetical protein